MPNRILKESTLTSPNLNECSISAQDLFKRILVMVDDYGCCEGNVPIIYGRAYSMCMDIVNLDDIKRWRQELINHNLIEIWDEGKREYIVIPNSEKHLFSKKCYTDEGNPTRHRRRTPEPPSEIILKKSQSEPERANNRKEVPNPNPNPNPNPTKEFKEVPITNFKNLINNSKEEPREEPKKANHIEFDFELLSWHGVDDDIRARWAKIFPHTEVEAELMMMREFFKKHSSHEKVIEEKFQNNYTIYIFDWLMRAEKWKIEDLEKIESKGG